ncbi:Putative hypothetical protein [Helicobacter mustelae 12198]|uniref:Uncharacterized protein n=2 Tax=Helicobacter mustelae TaxID=217 RepID=D3UHR4_HELM1|nr:hypothetical protein [Helicobacter mustelae]CBG40036.1 Putative hypothetical protein [Helicobacter mustelae 12198]SQH71549.1 Uncharacterised protein [Helicobacter mustelae]
MLDSVINSSTAIESNAPSAPTKKGKIEAQVKDEQESFAKMIEKKASEAKNTSDVQSNLAQGVAHQALKEASGAFHQKELGQTSKDAPAKMDMPAKNLTPTKQDAPKLSDLKTLAEQKNLNPQKLSLEKEQPQKAEPKKIVASKTHKEPSKDVSTENTKVQKMSTQELLEQKKQNPIKSQKPVGEPLAQALREINTKDLALRKKQNQENKMEYKQEGGEKIAVIQRGHHLPKNIAEPRLREEKKELELQKVLDKFGVVHDNGVEEDAGVEAKKKTLNS